MRSPSSQKIPGNRGKIKACVRAIRRGGVVIFPTETVYALACDSSNKKTLRKLCKLKGRDRKKPMQLLLGDFADLGRYARLDAIPQDILRALAKLWPGPLTAVLPATSAGRAISGRSSIGVRMPAHRLALSILKNAGVPVAAIRAGDVEAGTRDTNPPQVLAATPGLRSIVKRQTVDRPIPLREDSHDRRRRTVPREDLIPDSQRSNRHPAQRSEDWLVDRLRLSRAVRPVKLVVLRDVAQNRLAKLDLRLVEFDSEGLPGEDRDVGPAGLDPAGGTAGDRHASKRVLAPGCPGSRWLMIGSSSGPSRTRTGRHSQVHDGR